jgi:hypothetical protein
LMVAYAFSSVQSSLRTVVSASCFTSHIKKKDYQITCISICNVAYWHIKCLEASVTDNRFHLPTCVSSGGHGRLVGGCARV